MNNVTQVTARATQDDMTAEEYRDIYDELRERRSLRDFARLSGTGYSIAWWNQYEAGKHGLNYLARCDLRRAVGLAPLPVPVADAIKAGVDDDAEVWRIGDDSAAERVLLLAMPGAVTVHWNGAGPQLVEHVQNADVTPVTRLRTRARVWRPCLPLEMRERLLAAGLDVREVLEAALVEATAQQWMDGG
jgi:hypothetical protein